MFKVLFETKATKNYDSVNEAFIHMTGESASDWGYETIEDIDRGEREGWLEFDGDTMKVYGEEGR